MREDMAMRENLVVDVEEEPKLLGPLGFKRKLPFHGVFE